MPPASLKDAHAPRVATSDTRFCFEERRVVSNEYIIRYENRFFQITKANKKLPRPKTAITVRKLLDGTIRLIWDNIKLNFIELTNKPRKEVAKAHFRIMKRGHFYSALTVFFKSSCLNP
ncbi:hypothetical protein DWQ65_04360 [Treponema phagedenis]|uniref:Transposase n=1 Tax=Treponema phagedenis TaxID=162 RepID=A0A0B7GVI9_TREPH|nr:hypothetical protein HMPREF9554_03109 [Treponema phagedenis F0421]QSH94504.1 hypothetical protein C5O78_05520 [Treponema phagedenis]QSH99305.1 hypothetical protein DWQ65_04360 [Treponema phagedenis]CEM61562.1 conserved hypothetical protein [Treponema phagedenis]